MIKLLDLTQFRKAIEQTIKDCHCFKTCGLIPQDDIDRRQCEEHFQELFYRYLDETDITREEIHKVKTNPYETNSKHETR